MSDDEHKPGMEPAARSAAARSGASTPVRDALARRRSHSKVTDEAPGHAELVEILSTMNAVADHSGLRPWRVIELRGKARKKLGKAFAQASGNTKEQKEKYIAKATRAPLLLAIVVAPKKGKIPRWEQEAVASGVAHHLGLLLQEAGWGSMWRTGELTRAQQVHEAMKLGKHEYLLGWLYVGGIPDRDQKPKRRKPLDASRHLSAL